MAQKNVLSIFFEGLKIYCLNIHKFLAYMAFPILGQILGISMIFATVFWLTQNAESITAKYSALNEISNFMLFAIAVSIPGLIILLKAFWEYLIAYGALNSMTEGYLNTGKVYDFKSHKSVILNKTFSFILLWLLFSIFIILSLIPIFWIIGFIFFIYFILIFQVFTFENGLSPIGYFRRSFELIRGNFLTTFILFLLLFITTYYLIPAGLNVLANASNISSILSKPFESWAFTLPIEPLEPYGITPYKIAQSTISQIILFIAIGFTLPLRSICWSLWYDNLNTASVNSEPQKTTKKKQNKKNKDFKIEKREIDPEIIRRARLEDDEY